MSSQCSCQCHLLWTLLFQSYLHLMSATLCLEVLLLFHQFLWWDFLLPQCCYTNAAQVCHQCSKLQFFYYHLVPPPHSRIPNSIGLGPKLFSVDSILLFQWFLYYRMLCGSLSSLLELPGVDLRIFVLPALRGCAFNEGCQTLQRYLCILRVWSCARVEHFLSLSPVLRLHSCAPSGNHIGLLTGIHFLQYECSVPR